jgi:hypothetical protein
MFLASSVSFSKNQKKSEKIENLATKSSAAEEKLSLRGSSFLLLLLLVQSFVFFRKFFKNQKN